MHIMAQTSNQYPEMKSNLPMPLELNIGRGKIALNPASNRCPFFPPFIEFCSRTRIDGLRRLEVRLFAIIWNDHIVLKQLKMKPKASIEGS